jgi:integrase
MKAHLREHAAMGRDGLLFPAGHGEQLAPSTLYQVFYPARQKAGRADLPFHDLRHTDPCSLPPPGQPWPS